MRRLATGAEVPLIGGGAIAALIVLGFAAAMFFRRKPTRGSVEMQDHAALGAALPDSVQYYRVRKLQEMGCNAIRTSHNPPTPELLNACDELGVLVFDETRMMSSRAHFR